MKSEKIWIILRVLAWVAMVGYIIHFAHQFFDVVVDISNRNSYRNTPEDTSGRLLLTELDLWSYLGVKSFILTLSAMFAFLWYRVIHLLSEINLSNPFTTGVVKKLEGLAYQLFTIWLIGTIGRQVVKHMSLDATETQDIVGGSTEFLFTAGIVYIISQIFKHGVALQQEQDLTI